MSFTKSKIISSLKFKLHHISLKSKNPKRLKDFYKDIFNFKVVHTFKSKKKETYGYFLYVSRGCFIEILKLQNKDNVKNKENFHFCLIIKKNFFELYEYCKKNKIIYKNMLPSRGRTDKTFQFKIIDLDKNICEIHLDDKKNKLHQYN